MSTGVYDQNVNDALNSYALKDVEFTYLRVADVVQLTGSAADGADFDHVETLYGVSKTAGADLLNALGLGNGAKCYEKADGSDQLGDSKYYYQSDVLISALSTALKANATGNTQQARDARALMEEYGKSIIMDYSYKYFYSDGYGKDYRIYNLQGTVDPEQKHLYLVGCLLSFYQQMKLFEVNADALREFRIEKPLLVFVGNRVTAPVKSSGLSQAEKDLLTDVEEVLLFLNKFLSNRTQSIEHIRAVLNEDTGLIDASGKELFYQDFRALQGIFGLEPNPAEIFADVLRIVFNTDGNADEPRLRMENIRQVSGEIGLKVGEYGDYFGVINIGDTSGLLKS